MKKEVIHSERAPQAIGPYSQAVRAGQTVYLSGQIPLNPDTMEMITESFTAQAIQVFENIKAVSAAADASLDHIVSMTILLSDMAYYPEVNEIMFQYFSDPFPARAAYAVKSLPKNADIEIIAILITE